jgi:glutamine cyclotransferase
VIVPHFRARLCSSAATPSNTSGGGVFFGIVRPKMVALRARIGDMRAAYLFARHDRLDFRGEASLISGMDIYDRPMFHRVFRRMKLRAAALAAGVLLSAGWPGFVARAGEGGQTNLAAAPVAPAAIVNYTYEIVNTFPHDSKAFTQGLLFMNGKFYESTGLYGSSSLRQVDPATGKVLRFTPLSNLYFAEGLAELDGKLYQLTWKEGKAFVYDEKTFASQGQFAYEGEGWGLTTDGHWLILSDGTSDIRFLDPATFKADHVIHVTRNDIPQANLNELEYVKGEIFANIWQTDYVARIDPATGRIVGMIDFNHLLPLADHAPDTDVLNGIAYDPAGDRLFVTGKRWPKLFEVRLKLK